MDILRATANVIVVKTLFCQCTGRLQCKITIIITTMSVQLSSQWLSFDLLTIKWHETGKRILDVKFHLEEERRSLRLRCVGTTPWTVTVAELLFPRGSAAMITYAQLEKSNCWESCQLSWVPQLLLMIYYRSAATFASRKTLSVESWGYTLMDENKNWIIFLLCLPHTLSSLLVLVTRERKPDWVQMHHLWVWFYLEIIYFCCILVTFCFWIHFLVPFEAVLCCRLLLSY